MKSSKDIFMETREAETISQNTPSRTQVVSNALQTILSLDAATIDTLARAVVNEVADGNKDALETLIIAKKGAALFKAIDDNVKHFAYSKPYATKGENVVRFGCKVEPAELGVKYDYSTAADPTWAELNQQFEAIKKKKEAREKFLKTINGTLSINDQDTGEVVEIKAPVKSGELGYKIIIQ